MFLSYQKDHQRKVVSPWHMESSHLLPRVLCQVFCHTLFNIFYLFPLIQMVVPSVLYVSIFPSIGLGLQHVAACNVILNSIMCDLICFLFNFLQVDDYLHCLEQGRAASARLSEFLRKNIELKSMRIIQSWVIGNHFGCSLLVSNFSVQGLESMGFPCRQCYIFAPCLLALQNCTYQSSRFGL